MTLVHLLRHYQLWHRACKRGLWFNRSFVLQKNCVRCQWQSSQLEKRKGPDYFCPLKTSSEVSDLLSRHSNHTTEVFCNQHGWIMKGWNLHLKKKKTKTQPDCSHSDAVTQTFTPACTKERRSVYLLDFFHHSLRTLCFNPSLPSICCIFSFWLKTL